MNFTPPRSSLINRLQKTQGGQPTYSPNLDTSLNEVRKIAQKRIQELFQHSIMDPRSPEVRQRARSLVLQILMDSDIDMPRPTQIAVAEEIVSDLLGYGPLEPYFNDPEVTEIKVNRYDCIMIEKHGKETKAEVTFRDEQHCRDILERMLAPTGRRIDLASPRVSARLPDGSRLMAHIPPVAVEGTTFSVRRFKKGLTAEDLIRSRMFNEETLDFLAKCVRGRLNLICSGGTSSGKTTVLNVMAGFIPEDESIITIEDPAELQLNHPNVRRWEARPAGVEGYGEITQRDLMADALRAAPKRIIVGEVRRGEAFDMLQAMNTGHDGSMTTLHANSAEEALNSRLVNMVQMADMGLPYEAIIGQIAGSVDLVAQICKDRTGRRRLDHIVEVVGTEVVNGRLVVAVNYLYRYDREKDTWVRTAREFARREKLAWQGIQVQY
ncbi:MAG: CpaF family protein [Syntrophothermus sp.]|uniref:CpaF family protein n=1 Tax=Syntrophothermus sp. TaxID=2736299 RepID=UPI00257BCCA6|nr:CpaF family protein [Syntrophothermus sp.]NSW83600.1 CpaF family protein [Syntrophothermus sp.]